MSEELKKAAAFRAVAMVATGMVLGLGTGTTTRFALLELARRLKSGELKDIVGIPSSLQTEQIALSEGIPLTDLENHPRIDLTIDGADEVDDELNLIKGGGGALLREKVLAQNSSQNVIIVDQSKISHQLGKKWAVPVEVLPFALGSEKQFLTDLGAEVSLRTLPDGQPFRTDQDNLILDAAFGTIREPEKIARAMEQRAGIIEHGLFLGLATRVIIASEEGISIRSREDVK